MAAPALASLSLLGVSHAQASVEAREQLSISHDDANGFLAELRARGLIDEGVVLSTCNRMELYCAAERQLDVKDLAAAYGSASLAEHAGLFYRKQGRELIKHAFAVACGLDSMILGEPEILGQMKKAYAEARQAGFAGASMGLLFERAFRVAKVVRTETSIARESVSASALCAKLAQDIFGSLEGCQVLCVGGGAIIETALAHFSGGGVGGIAVANRTPARATALAERSGAQAVPFEELAARLHGYDIVIAATAAPRPVIGRAELAAACDRRRRRPMAVFDLAVPRDVDPASAALEDVYLYSIDDIGAMASVNMDKRRQALNEAERHIAQAAEELVARLAANGRAPEIEALRERLRGIEEAESARALREIAAGKDPEAAVRELARRLTGKLSHDSVSALANGSSAPETIEAISGWYRQGGDDG